MGVILLLFNVFVLSNGCSWCPGGIRTFNGVRPTSNGCGSGMSSQLLNSVLTQRTIPCCNSHDLCYHNCGKTKAQCDNEFRGCLRNLCARYPDEGTCVQRIMSFFVEKTVWGCNAYQEAQRTTCNCRDIIGR